ncbi:hypothetical protein CCM_04462 [Cordyceps militaris CM01]|uniref:Uncharacterized protein n=1 Tax=Cordyceps militaris (strain CM01) TaxID=983644 RepID=G3JF34_CORMM|nr:uncharacterized protein CCM_04462 [Cordyceps militaris CM01]EGX93090.1 hypothetical protein CCM_04462 [Cordyceps militaris CM01]
MAIPKAGGKRLLGAKQATSNERRAPGRARPEFSLTQLAPPYPHNSPACFKFSDAHLQQRCCKTLVQRLGQMLAISWLLQAKKRPEDGPLHSDPGTTSPCTAETSCRVVLHIGIGGSLLQELGVLNAAHERVNVSGILIPNVVSIVFTVDTGSTFHK